MNIQEATTTALASGKCIKRTTEIWKRCKVQLGKRNVCHLYIEGKFLVQGWQPQAEDLIADDWVTE